ncbi:MAG: SRPBCC family protein [Geodermatophilaceae bacterium]
MSTVTESVDVEVPIKVAYDQWTQFESFPQFMDGVEEIRQLDDTHTHWVVKVGGVTREFDATITEQHPEERVAWRTDDGPNHAGVVTFHRLDDNQTRVTAQMDIDPEGLRGERRRQGRHPRSQGQGGHEAVQGVHREPRLGDRKLAWRRRAPWRLAAGTVDHGQTEPGYRVFSSMTPRSSYDQLGSSQATRALRATRP